MVDSEQWLSRKDAALKLGVHVRTLDRLVRDGRLDRYYLGTRTPRFRIEDVRKVPALNGPGR